MNWNFTLTVLGVVATVLFGVVGTWLVLRHKDPGEITFVREYAIGLLESLSNPIPELRVTYMDKPVEADVVLLRGALINTGRMDIAPPLVEEPITVTLPEGFSWHGAQVVGCSRGVQASASAVDEKTIKVTVGLLRRGEHVEIEALGTVPREKGGKRAKGGMGKQLTSALGFRHRIANTGNIAQRSLVDLDFAERRWKRTLPLLAAGLTVVVVSIVMVVKEESAVLHYPLRMADGRIATVQARPRSDGRMQWREVGRRNGGRLANEVFVARLAGPQVIGQDRRVLVVGWLLSIVYIAIPVLLFLARYLEFRKERIIWRQLEGGGPELREPTG